ncbi:hypothetical protein FY050_04725 [Phyllobacterium endophyticum]|uniref:Nuclease n=1 Tax=Phyllobacterium endophyticum TaxID=1149773 RepID=A0A2P7ASJ8_9HYPH|nr:hypothetical protein [Phyllobacterium endophyticum]PSH57201.1 hypothetical protein CU100_14415 [Phyllobacterium endophyticum]TYR44557.1 hypothetical protein FY050_04725 [Phyllobacterium endophyticum]
MKLTAALAVCVLAGQTWAGGEIDRAYVKSLAAPGKKVAVVEYYDPAGKVVDRMGFASPVGFVAVSPVDIEINQNTRLHLYGLEICSGEMANLKEGFTGTCADFARQQLEVLVREAKVLFCRAFLTERDASRQDVTCFGYYYYPGSLDTVDNLEEQLVSVGALRLAKKPDGALMRPDLAEAEKIGRGGFGMWGDPRMRGQ